MKDLTNLIGDHDCLEQFRNALTNEDKIKHVIAFLNKKNDIMIYTKFINIWKEHDPALASQFENILRTEIHNAGLTEG